MRVEFESINLFMLVMVRLIGMFGFNPLLSRRNIPAQVRAGLVLLLTILLTPSMDAAAVNALDDFETVIVLFKEFAVGLILGYVFQVFYYMLFFVGDQLDMSLGFSMAKAFDPGTNIQMALTSTMLSVLFVFYFFASDSHLSMLHLFSTSFKILPVGAVVLSNDLWRYMLALFVDVFMLVMRLLMPFIVTELCLQIALGVLMKLVPQIHVFVINFQLKILLGLLLLVMTMPLIGGFIGNYIQIMMDQMQQSILLMGGVLP